MRVRHRRDGERRFTGRRFTGRLQWGGKAGRPEFVASMQKTYRPPSDCSPQRDRLPSRAWQAIDFAVTTGVAFDPDRRFRSDRDWLNALEVAWRELDVLPSPSVESTGVWERLRSFFRRV